MTAQTRWEIDESERTWKSRLQLPWNSMLRPMLLVLLELENSLSRAVRMEQASVCCSREAHVIKKGSVLILYCHYFKMRGMGWDLGAACSKMEKDWRTKCVIIKSVTKPVKINKGSCVHLCPPQSVNQQNRLEKGTSSVQVELGCALATPQKNIWNTALCWLERRTAVWSLKILLFKYVMRHVRTQ